MQVNWLIQLMAEISLDMNALGSSGRTFVLPVSATTIDAAVLLTSMSYMRSGRACIISPKQDEVITRNRQASSKR